jgi:hypothetical protein
MNLFTVVFENIPTSPLVRHQGALFPFGKVGTQLPRKAEIVKREACRGRGYQNSITLTYCTNPFSSYFLKLLQSIH